jgi:hypothetical protein
MAAEQAVDPREFTPAEWNIIAAVLRERARSLEWKAKRPGVSTAEAAPALAAAERRRALASRCVGAKIFCNGLVPDNASLD